MKCKAFFNCLAVKDCKFNVVSTCCKSILSKKDNSHVSYKSLREMVLKGDYNEHCLKCTAKNIYDDLEDNNTIQHIFYKIGDKCNAICRTCRNSLISEDYENNYKNLQIFLDLYNNHHKTLKKITIMGGETFLYINELKTILNNINNDNIEIIFNTNGIILSDEILEILNNRGNVIIYFSLDGDYNTNHILRKNCYMEKIIKNIDKVKKYGNIKLKIHHVVSVLNIINFETNMNYYINNLNIPASDIYIGTVVIYPINYSLMNLPNDIIVKCKEKILSYDLPNDLSFIRLIETLELGLVNKKSNINIESIISEITDYNIKNEYDIMTLVDDVLKVFKY